MLKSGRCAELALLFTSPALHLSYGWWPCPTLDTGAAMLALSLRGQLALPPPCTQEGWLCPSAMAAAILGSTLKLTMLDVAQMSQP